MTEKQAAEVAWYRKYGRNPSRIKRDSSGAYYIIGDSSWNVDNNPKERIENKMAFELTGCVKPVGKKTP